MSKKIACLFMAVLMVLLSCGTAFAEEIPAGSGQPGTSAVQDDAMVFLSYTNHTTTQLSISNGTATCTSTILGYSGTTTGVKIVMHLQRKVLWWWTDVASWEKSEDFFYTSLTQTSSVGGGMFRTYTEYTAYAGSASETIQGFSSEVNN